MNKILETAIERVRKLSDAEQAEIAELLMTLTGDTTGPVNLSEDERAVVQVGLDQARRGEFVPDADMDAFWNRKRA